MFRTQCYGSDYHISIVSTSQIPGSINFTKITAIITAVINQHTLNIIAITSHNLSPELKEGQEFYSVLLLVVFDGYTNMKVSWNLEKTLNISLERCIPRKKTQVKMVEDIDTFPYNEK